MDHQWHYDYARLAWDAGFVFEKNHPFNVEKSKLSLLDIDRIVKERDISTVEQYIPLVIHYVLEDDQAEILDSSFVKIFQISQLAIEYLLFCKKYLDNTVVLLKKEMSRLKKQMDMFSQKADYDTNLLPNPRRDYLTAVFKCEKCEKAFSSENYLNSHIKRKHNGEIFAPTGNDDKLQSEIKELKERLNSTDKLLQQIHISEPQVEKNKTNDHILTDLEKKFCSFREQVENEIASLHLEKNMYEEKYTKLFDLMLKSKEKPQVVLETIGTMTSEEGANEVYEPFKTKKTTVDNFTQTREVNLHAMTEETVEKMPICNTEANQNFTDDKSKELEGKLLMLSDDIDNKLSTSMNIIKDQMQTFWEQMKKESTDNRIDTLQESINSNEATHSKEIVKPQVKPRTKLFKPITHDMQQQQPILTSVRTKPTESIVQNETKQYKKNIMNENIVKRRDSANSKHTEDEIIEIKPPKPTQYDSASETESVKTATSISDIQSIETEVKNNEKSNSNDHIKINIIPEINKILYQRFHGLQSFSISGKKFRRAIEILSKDPNFKKQVQGNSPRHKLQKSSDQKNKVSQKRFTNTNTVRIHLNRPIRQGKETRDSIPKPLVEIKNKSLYDTDSETDRGFLERKSESEGDKFEHRKACDQVEDKEKNILEIPPSTSNITKKVIFEDFSSDEQSESEIATTFGVNSNR